MVDAEVDEERANLERLLSDSPASGEQSASPSASAAEQDESLLVCSGVGVVVVGELAV